MEAFADRASLNSALRKARWRILPLLALGYLIAFTDRSNISFAAETMNRDLHFTPYVYGLGAGLFFVSYALCEIPSNALLLRVGARRWLARIMFTWGLLAAAMMFVRGAPSFYGMRLLLGAAEAGFFPGALYFLAQWFPSAHRARAISWFYVSLPLSSTVMGLASAPLLRLDWTLGLRGWQWLFLLEGLPAVLLGVVLWLCLPGSLRDAQWLTHLEREALASSLREQPHPSDNHHGWPLLASVLREPRVWVLGLFNFCLLAAVYAISFFLPSLVRQLTGLSVAGVGSLIALSGVLGALSMLLNSMHSDRTMERRWHILVPTLLMAGMTLLAGLHLRGAAVGVLLCTLLVVYVSILGPLCVLATELCRGRGAALAIATFNMCGIMGGFVGPYYMGWMRGWTGSYAVGVGSISLFWFIAAGCILWVTAPRPVAAAVPHEKLRNVEPEPAK